MGLSFCNVFCFSSMIYTGTALCFSSEMEIGSLFLPPLSKNRKVNLNDAIFCAQLSYIINYLHHSFLNMKFLFEVYCTGISVLLLFISGDDYYHFPKKQSNWVLKKRLIRNKQQDMINQASQVSTLCLTLKIQLIWIEPRF